MIADLDDLFTALYVFADEFLPRRRRARRRPPISDAEPVCLAVAQISPRRPLGEISATTTNAAAPFIARSCTRSDS